jgi:hypothetical protein
MNASNYLENAALRHVLGVAAFTPPSTIYCALSTSTPNDAGGVTEPSGGSYARQTVAFTVSGTTPTIAVNSAMVSWPTATAPWGAITYVCLFDALTGGNLLFWLRLVSDSDFATPTSKAIDTGDIFEIPATQLRVRCD